MNPQTSTEDQTNHSLADEQFAKAIEQQQKENQSLSNVLDSAVDETERRARDRIVTQGEDFKHKQRLASLFARSGCFADVKGQTAEQSIAQAFVKITLGEAMGFSATESMAGVQLIQGTPAISAQLRAARMQRAGFSWQIDWFDEKGICTGCRLWLYRDGKPVLKPKRDVEGNQLMDDQGNPLMEHVSVSFMKQDAEMLKTKIWEGYGEKRTSRTASVLEKDNWKNTPKNMYFARAVTNLQRWYAPGILSGDIPSAEEVQDENVSISNGATPTETVDQVKERKIQEAKEWAKQHGFKLPAAGQQENPKPQENGSGSTSAPEASTQQGFIEQKQADDLMSLMEEKGMSQAEMLQLIKGHGFKTLGAITVDRLADVANAMRAWQKSEKVSLFGNKAGK